MTRLQKIFQQIPDEEWEEWEEDTTETDEADEADVQILRQINEFYNDHLQNMIELHEKFQILETEEEYQALLKLKELLDDRTMDEVRYERSLWSGSLTNSWS